MVVGKPARRLECVRVRQNEPRVHDDRASLTDDDGIEIELGEVAVEAHQQPALAANPHQQVDQGGTIDRSPTARTVEEPRAAKVGEHRHSVPPGDRTQPERDILQYLDEDAAEADHQQRPEPAIPHRADDHLDAGRTHCLDQIPIDACRAYLRSRCD
ncbi:MAG: hypothetical protein ABI920_07395 [Casimicrobiaceae bacterium]